MQYQSENRCLYCYDKLENGLYHQKCSLKFFGEKNPPVMPFSGDDMVKLAENIVKSHTTVTGVQPKLSLGFRSLDESQVKKFTITGVMGDYILKPQSETYPSLPELESLTMHLAEISKIKTVPHSLIPLKSGELAYITKRLDRIGGQKVHMEDMCQLTERLTEDKYKGSYEQIGKKILEYSIKTGLDIINFYEVVLFSYLTGNSDMHLKNFSLVHGNGGYTLSPAYDLLSTKLVIPEDDEELALNLNGRKKKLKKRDFSAAMETSGIKINVINNMFKRFKKDIEKWLKFIEISFISTEIKDNYKELIIKRSAILN